MAASSSELTAGRFLHAPTTTGGAVRWLIAISVSLGALMEVVDVSIVNVALTDMQSSLGATLSEVGWVITGYSIANVIILPLTAWLGDVFGKKRYFVFSLVAFTGASMLCAMSTSLAMLIAARVLQGLFGGGLLSKAQSILFENFPREQQAQAQALFGAVVIAGPTLGPTVGGFLVTNFNWRWIFFINLPVGIAAILMSLLFLPADEPKEERQPKGGVDWPGILFLCIAMGGLQTVLEQGQDNDWFSSRFIVIFSAAAVVGLILFVIRELQVEHPAVDLRVLRYRSLAGGSAVSMVIGIALYGAVFALPIFTQSFLGFTAEQTGLLLMPGALATAFMMPVVGKLNGKIDARLLMAVGMLVLFFSMWELQAININTSVGWFFWPLIIRGLAMGFIFLPLTLATLSPIPKADIPAATGLFNLTRQLGGSIGIAILTTFLSRREAFHHHVLVETVAPTNPITQARYGQLLASMIAHGRDAVTAKTQALLMLDGAVSRQAAILSFADTFYLVGLVILFSLPLVFLLGKGDRGSAPAGGH